ncbi:hypothetical protein, conserved [Trypanosoma brucei gambiense DAL972]|uniref:Ubiquitin-like domain-containing protein n=2 Tax=Trypanosoma brucei TaxID=5691 RepID=D0AAD8_TRYB9|nr:hypothetical protein, conserved [Trypanosoma brucei gambiense DAL972]RHW68253.1 hypothetical protein DPX39_110132800 [Trypanosoma brucei equiperdum]CBH18639.1 hypothetical protein, conserved [Trypanosoma brucei gambiense DAL972]|eukprot:XP_011780903.1 hypothetical protein, conserved [Trypanosoma brucei gambiense DAL972]
MSEVADFSDSADEWEATPKVPVDDAEEAANGKPKPKRPQIDQLTGEERELAGELLKLVFHLPDGSVQHREHFMGQTVSYLKAQLEDVDGLPYERTTLFFEDRQLLDPLSLNDLPFSVDGENHITVRLSN